MSKTIEMRVLRVTSKELTMIVAALVAFGAGDLAQKLLERVVGK